MLRRYTPSDCAELAALFYSTVHTVNAKDYTKDHLNAWADGNIDLNAWNQSFLHHYSIVAVEENKIIGFGDIDTAAGYLDRLFVHAEYQGMGVGSAICSQLEEASQGTVTVHASVTAKDFFMERGYTVIKKQQVKRKGVFLVNFVMKK